MAKNSVNWNILIVAGAVVAGLYLVKEFKKGNVAQNYTSALSGQTLSEASQSTIKTDLRQAARVELAEDRQTTRLSRAEIRQNARTLRAQNRQETRLKIWDMVF